MRNYKIEQGGYIVAIGTGSGGEEICTAEYTRLMALINARPTPPDGYGYRLAAAEAWEMYELPSVEDTDPDVDADAALAEIAEVIG